MFPICLIWLVAATAGAELRDYPGCGQLGSRDKRECHWDCVYKVLAPRTRELSGKISDFRKMLCSTVSKRIFPANLFLKGLSPVTSLG